MFDRYCRIWAIIIVSVLCAFADTAAQAAGRRVALVIGNSAYQVGPLANPANDAIAVAKAFESLGFDRVILKSDLSAEAMKSALAEMAREATGAEIAVVYYAGHGTERDGHNYLIPVDANLERATDLGLQAIPLSTVIDQVSGASRLKLVILDACRNNVFTLAGAKRATSRGLARIEPEDNTLVVYAAKEGTTADDGSAGTNSPFTTSMLKHIATPGLEVSFVFRRVRDEVMGATGGNQQPHTYGTLGGEPIFLVKGQDGEQTAVLAPPQANDTEMKVTEKSMPVSDLVSRKLKLSARIVRRPGATGPSVGWLGVVFQQRESASLLLQFLGLPAAGAFVTSVVGGSPAAIAGIQVGDVVAGFDGRDLLKPDDLVRFVGLVPLDTIAAVEVWRIGAGTHDLRRFVGGKADAGDVKAMYALALLDDLGVGAAPTAEAVTNSYRKAAEAGSSAGMLMVADRYESGLGVTKDDAEATRWYRKAAEAGDVKAMGLLGDAIENGRGIAKDETEAVRWYRKAAEAGDTFGMARLGLMLERGRGLGKDEAEAVRWYRKAAEAGDAWAMTALGVGYDQGRGVEKDGAEALRWYRKAAEGGDFDGMYNLGVVLDSPKSASRDPAEAAKWMFDAIFHGSKTSVDQMTTNSTAWSKEFRTAFQEKLKEAGLYSGPIDGKFGASVKQAIEKLAAKGGAGKAPN